LRRILKLNNKENFDADSDEIVIFRVCTIVIPMAVVFWGLLTLYLDENAIDNMSHRLLISFIWLTLFILSFKSKFIRQYNFPLLIVMNITTLGWVIWIVYVNKFSPNYSFGLFVGFGAVGVVSRNWKEMSIYHLFIFSFIFYAFYLLEEIKINHYVYSISLLNLLVINSIIMYWRERMNDKLSKLNRKLQEKNKDLEQFVYVASHDLKAPLKTVGGFTSMLRRQLCKNNYESAEQYAQYIGDSVDRMENVVNDLLDYSKSVNEKVKLEPTNLSDVLNDVTEMLVSDPINSNVKVILPESLPKKVMCNPGQIRQLFQNLIQNAIKYNRAEIKTIAIACEMTKKNWTFKVKDNGIGIPLESQDKIFDMFARVHGEQFDGTGIGLALVKKIVERHNGQIGLESEVGKGTMFWFTIPK